MCLEGLIFQCKVGDAGAFNKISADIGNLLNKIVIESNSKIIVQDTRGQW